MNDISQHVTSLELSRKLKELGVKQESFIYWLNIPDIFHMKLNDDGTLFEDETGSSVIDRIEYKIKLGYPGAYNVNADNRWSAFLSSQLGEIIQWRSLYIFGLPQNLPEFADSSTECDARAKILIKLIENESFSEAWKKEWLV
jgi:hypothetical protein